METLKEAQKNQANDPTLPENQPAPKNPNKEQTKTLSGGIVLKWVPGEETGDPNTRIPGLWTDITEYIPFTNIPASQAKEDGMDVDTTTAPGDKNGRPQSPQSDGTTTAPEIGDGKIGSDDTTEPEFGYEPSNNLNIKANDIIGKSMGDINNVSEADLDFLFIP